VQSIHTLNLPPSLRTPHLWPDKDKANLTAMINQRAAQERSQKASADYARYQTDPHGYARDVLKVTLTADQSDILTSLIENRYTLAQASHSVGKTFIAAVAANWWFDCWPEHICYITAPTWDQAKGLTFKAIKTVRRELHLPGDILETGIVRDEDKILEGRHYIRALNAESGEGFQGEHEAPILIIVEEGVGVPKYIWSAIKGLMTAKDCRVFVIGNPTDEATEFGKAAQAGSAYHVIRISGLDHPNIAAELQGEQPPFPKAISLLWLFEMLRDECERVDKLSDDAFEFHSLPSLEGVLRGEAPTGETWFYAPTADFQGRVLGIFPTQADEQVIPKGWMESQPVLEWSAADVPELGCDPAHMGKDRSTIFSRIGPCLIAGREIRKMDSVEVATACKDEALEVVRVWKGEQWKADTDLDDQIALAKTIRIKVDVTGGLGTGPHDILKNDGYNAVAVNSSARAHEPEQYLNIRSELWFEQRFRAKEKRLDMSRLRKDIRERLKRELGAPKYKTPGHKIVESKDDMRKRLGQSPDLADGCNLAFYNPPVRHSSVEVTGSLSWADM